MSEYRDLVSDFPTRCDSLLHLFEKQARRQRLEITLMLCIAAPSIIVPFERLQSPKPRPDGSKSLGHPSRDWTRFLQAKSAFDNLCAQRFLGSPLWPNATAGSWHFDELSDVSGDPDGWRELRTPKPLGRNRTINRVLKHVRNALAHGNIFTRGGDEITQLLFVSKPDQNIEKFWFLAASPDDFRIFLKNWLDFLRTVNLPTGVVPESSAAWFLDQETSVSATEAH